MYKAYKNNIPHINAEVNMRKVSVSATVTQCIKPVEVQGCSNLTPNIKVGLTSKFLIGLSQNHCCIATNHKFSSKKGNKTFSVQDFVYFKAPSEYACILALWLWVKQWPMACSVSWILRRKRSRSLAISSQCPLRDACRANGHVLMTWT